MQIREKTMEVRIDQQTWAEVLNGISSNPLGGSGILALAECRELIVESNGEEWQPVRSSSGDWVLHQITI